MVASDPAAATVGLYSASEVARYAQLHPSTLRSWFYPRRGEARLRHSTNTAPEEEGLLSFTDFVEAAYVRLLRAKYGISFPSIRSAITTAQTLENIQYPFANPEFRTAVLGKEIFFIRKDRPDVMTAISGRGAGQMADRVILEEWIDHLEFDENLLVAKYIALIFKSERVILSPKTAFGEPFLESCGYTAERLFDAFIAEGGAEQAARAYDVTVEAVEASVKYCRETLKMAA